MERLVCVCGGGIQSLGAFLFEIGSVLKGNIAGWVKCFLLKTLLVLFCTSASSQKGKKQVKGL